MPIYPTKKKREGRQQLPFEKKKEKKKKHTSSCSIVWPRGMIIWLPVNLVGLIPG